VELLDTVCVNAVQVAELRQLGAQHCGRPRGSGRLRLSSEGETWVHSPMKPSNS